MNSETQSSYDKLNRNIALSIIIVSMAPLLMVGGLIFDQFRSIYHEKVYAHLSEVVDKHADNIDTFLQDKLFETQYLGTAYSFEELTTPQFLETTLKGVQQQYGRIFVDLGVIDETGRQVAYAGPYDLLDADYSEADWYRNSRSLDVHISDVFEGLRQSPHFIIAINGMSNGKSWTLRATIDFLAFSNLVENIRIGETGYAYILNSKGVLQTRPPENRSRAFTYESVKSLSYDGAPSGVRIQETTSIDGEEYLMVSSKLNNGDWQLIYQQNMSDAFSAMKRTEYFTLIIFLLGGVSIIAMALLISRKLVVRCQAIDQEAELMNKQIVETGKLAAIGELAAGIAHEINNPVAIMIEEAGWVSDLMQDEGQDLDSSSEIDRALRQVRSQGKRCKDITHKLLSFARQTDSRVTSVNLSELIREVIELSMQQARYNHVEFNLDLKDDMPEIQGSVTELQQVLLNFVNNSIQAMESGGGILSIACLEYDGQAEIIVADTGPGIPAANLSRVFEPFFTTKPVGKGSGLGLSICYGIIHQMGGEIEVESTVGVGTRFIIRLPFPPPYHQETKEIHHD